MADKPIHHNNTFARIFISILMWTGSHQISNLTVVPSCKCTEWLMKAAPTVTLLLGSNWPRTYLRTRQDFPTPCARCLVSQPGFHRTLQSKYSHASTHGRQHSMQGYFWGPNCRDADYF